MPHDPLFSAIFPPDETTVTIEKVDGMEAVSLVHMPGAKLDVPRAVTITRDPNAPPKPFRRISKIVVEGNGG